MASNGKGIFWWAGALGLLVIGSIAIAPRLFGKASAVTPAAPALTPAAVQSLASPPGYDYGVANSQYGRALRNYNFSGLALEQPTNVMPLGFHLNNIM